MYKTVLNRFGYNIFNIIVQNDVLLDIRLMYKVVEVKELYFFENNL